MICMYHANCADGMGAAWAVWSKYGDVDVTYIPSHYGDPIPDGVNGKDVLMVDFSYKYDQMLELSKRAKSITVYDHHKTAIEELSGRDGPNDFHCPVHLVLDPEKSGAVLTWEGLFPGVTVPELLDYIQDRDIWRFRLYNTKQVHAGLMLHQNWREWGTLYIADLIAEGSAVTKFLRIQTEKYISDGLTAFPPTGDRVPVYNLPGFMISDTLAAALEKYPDAPYAVAYFDLVQDKARVYSLRSRPGSDVDVSEIAKHFGGGGHKHAAGFKWGMPDA